MELPGPFALREDGAPDERLQDMVHTIRSHLGMEVGFVSEFKDGRRFFRHVDSASDKSPVTVGDSDPLEESFCYLVANGVLPEIMQNAAGNPAAAQLAVTSTLPVGAHLSAPIRLTDGSIFGTLCCFNYEADPSLGERDLKLLRLFADLAGRMISGEMRTVKTLEDKRRKILFVMENRDFSIVYQPLYHVVDQRLSGFEALCRFSAEPPRTADRWFADAAEVDLGAELELMVAHEACSILPDLPANQKLGLNVSPAAIVDERFRATFENLPVENIVLEMTEHAVIEDYAEIERALQPFRRQGLQVAVDDAGAGHSCFRHILKIKPDFIKLDISLVRDIDRERSQRALTEALTGFGRMVGSEIVAEGVETELEFNVLREIGVTKVQGYLLGYPMPMRQALALQPFLRRSKQEKARSGLETLGS